MTTSHFGTAATISYRVPVLPPRPLLSFCVRGRESLLLPRGFVVFGRHCRVRRIPTEAHQLCIRCVAGDRASDDPSADAAVFHRRLIPLPQLSDTLQRAARLA